MELFLNRYRNLLVLLLVLFAQLFLLTWQIKTSQDVPLVRVWAVTGVSVFAEGMEFVRRNTIGFVEDYLVLINVRERNEKLSTELGKLKLENQFLRSELEMADRVRALAAFQSRTQSRTVAARILGTGTGSSSSVIYVDRGSNAGVERGMAVITPDGIVGKVLAAFPTASQVMLITDPSFAAGVISQKNRVHGTLKGGQGYGKCIVDKVQNEEKVEEGEMFYSSGDDRIFPKGLPVGTVSVVRTGKTFKDIYLSPSALQGGLEEVLIVIEGVHEKIPEPQVAGTEMHLQSPPPEDASTSAPKGTTANVAPLLTDADRIRERYKEMGEAQNHVFGKGAVGSKVPDFTAVDPSARKPVPAPTLPVSGENKTKPPVSVSTAGAAVGLHSPLLQNEAGTVRPAAPLLDPVTGLPLPPKSIVHKPRLDPVTGLPLPVRDVPPAVTAAKKPVKPGDETKPVVPAKRLVPLTNDRVQ